MTPPSEYYGLAFADLPIVAEREKDQAADENIGRNAEGRRLELRLYHDTAALRGGRTLPFDLKQAGKALERIAGLGLQPLCSRVIFLYRVTSFQHGGHRWSI
jgi:hypothetical protein